MPSLFGLFNIFSKTQNIRVNNNHDFTLINKTKTIDKKKIQAQVHSTSMK